MFPPREISPECRLPRRKKEICKTPLVNDYGSFPPREGAKRRIRGSAKRWSPGLVKFVSAAAYHFCLALPAEFTQPGPAVFQPNCRALYCLQLSWRGRDNTPRALRHSLRRRCMLHRNGCKKRGTACCRRSRRCRSRSLTWHAAAGRRPYWSVGRSPEVFSSDALESFFLHSLKRRLRLTASCEKTHHQHFTPQLSPVCYKAFPPSFAYVARKRFASTM